MKVVSTILASRPQLAALFAALLELPKSSPLPVLIQRFQETAAECAVALGDAAPSVESIQYADCVRLAARHLGVTPGNAARTLETEFAIARRLMRELWLKLSITQRDALELGLSQRIASLTEGRLSGPSATLAGILEGNASSRQLVVLAPAVLGVMLWKRRLRTPFALYRSAGTLARVILRLPDELLSGLWADRGLSSSPFARLVPAVILASALEALEILDSSRVMDPDGMGRHPNEFSALLKVQFATVPRGVLRVADLDDDTLVALSERQFLLPGEVMHGLIYANERHELEDIIVITGERLMTLSRSRILSADLEDIRAIDLVRKNGRATAIDLHTLAGETLHVPTPSDEVARFLHGSMSYVADRLEATA